ncbi:RTA1-domain-containing protein [Auricularia subglabra TFB-10046 SS5]|nr:RTA1-domain-containing protein [Auricularia subglabra TFB-10046 SS5]
MSHSGPALSPPDPFADPANDPYNPLRYIPSNVLTSVGTALVAAVALAQVYMTVKYHIKWMLVMTLGCFTFAFGLATRFAFAKHPHSKSIYIVEYLLIVLSPCAFIAGTYVVLGRLARYLRADKYLLIRPTRVTLVFVLSDVATFLIQALGGSIAVSSNKLSTVKLGANQLFKVGLILQTVSFVIFSILVATFVVRVYRSKPRTWAADGDADKAWHADWRALLGALGVACATIMIRSFYRMAESLQGLHGALATTEWMFYVFDTLPLWLCIATFTLFWPGRFIPSDDAHVGAESPKPIRLNELTYGPGAGGQPMNE